MSTPARELGQAADDLSARPPLILGNLDLHGITEKVASIVEGDTPRTWKLLLAATLFLLLIFLASAADLVSTGIGEWGLNHPVGWAWDITGFVFWIGIGHAGTLISAASDDRFLLSVEAADPEFESDRTRELLAALGAKDIEEVLP
jgi:hypothetical protein